MSNTQQIPLIPLRDVVLFPRSEMPIYIGREASMRAIKLAIAQYNGKIAVFTQLKGEFHGPFTINDIHQVGTLATVVASVETTDQTIKAMFEGLERIRIVDLKHVDGVIMATVTSETEIDKNKVVEENDHADILALLSTWGPELQKSERAELQALISNRDIISVVSNLCSLTSKPRIDKPGAERAWESLENPSPPHYRNLWNQAIAHRQKVLEAPCDRQKLRHLIDALNFDIACRTEDF